MSNSKVESYQLEDLSILKEVNEFIDASNWYVVVLNNPRLGFLKPLFESLPLAQRLEVLKKPSPVWPLISKISPDGLWPGQDLTPNDVGELPIERLLRPISMIRQPYGWDDASTARRAPVIYKLFQHINSTYLDNRFTLDGIPEEVSGSRCLWYDDNEKEIPNWGNDVGSSGSRYDEHNPSTIWTAYANGKTPLAWNLFSSARRIAFLGNKGISNSAHRDYDGNYGEDESNANGCYTMIVSVNETWKYGEGLEIILYDTIPPGPNVSVHDRRGYGVGKPTHIFPHAPGQIILYPATTIHTTTSPGTIANNPNLGKNVVFRIKEKITK